MRTTHPFPPRRSLLTYTFSAVENCPPHSVLNKVAGGFTCDPGRFELGLQLKFKGDYCVLGYTQIADGQLTTTTTSGKDVWETSNDTLTVVGSEEAKAASGENSNERKRWDWEYSPKAIRLIANYCSRFPTVIAGLMKDPQARFYSVEQLFGNGKGEDALKAAKVSTREARAKLVQ